MHHAHINAHVKHIINVGHRLSISTVLLKGYNMIGESVQGYDSMHNSATLMSYVYQWRIQGLGPDRYRNFI